MEKGVDETISPKSFLLNFLLALTIVIIALGAMLLIIHGAANMSSKAKEFAGRCAAENGVVVPARTGDICIPKWIIFEEAEK